MRRTTTTRPAGSPRPVALPMFSLTLPYWATARVPARDRRAAARPGTWTCARCGAKHHSAAQAQAHIDFAHRGVRTS